MEKTVFIYTLSDPRIDEPRYVGKAKNKKARLKAHIIESKKGVNTYKCCWIRKLLREGVKPEIEILDIVPENEWKFWEIYWIAQMKSWGINLTNGTLGGDGHERKYRPVEQYDLQGNFIKSWDTISEAAKKLKICNTNITRCCKGKIKTVCGYIFKYKEDKLNLEDHIYNNRDKPVIQYSLKGEFIKGWDSMKSAEIELNMGNGAVHYCCKGKLKTSGGFIWKYKGEKLINLKEHIIDRKEKPVIQYDLQDNKVKKWNSMMTASRALGIHISSISSVCRKITKTGNGYVWKYANEISN